MTDTATVENTVAQNLAAWPERLRSGDFEQTTGKLKTEEGYCCIGVLDETVLGASWQPWEDGTFIDHNNQIATLKRGEASKVGLSKNITSEEAEYIADYFEDEELEEPPVFDEYDMRQDVLTALNDRGATFEEIADVVEHLEWHKIGE